MVAGTTWDMKLTSPRSKVCKHDTDVDRAREGASTKTTNGFWRDPRMIDWSDDGGLANTEPSNEASCVDLSDTASICEEDDDPKDPQKAQLSSCPETANPITEEKGTVYIDQHRL